MLIKSRKPRRDLLMSFKATCFCFGTSSHNECCLAFVGACRGFSFTFTNTIIFLILEDFQDTNFFF